MNIRLGQEATSGAIAAEKPDAIIVATGGRPVRPDIPGVSGKNVVYAADVMEGKAQVGKKVVIVGGGATGVEIALLLAKKGTIDPEAAVFLASRGGLSAEEAIDFTHRGSKEVTILEMLARIGEDIGRSTRWTVLQSLHLYNVSMITTAKVERITEKGLFYKRKEEEHFIEADTVVIAVGTDRNSPEGSDRRYGARVLCHWGLREASKGDRRHSRGIRGGLENLNDSRTVRRVPSDSRRRIAFTRHDK